MAWVKLAEPGISSLGHTAAEPQRLPRSSHVVAMRGMSEEATQPTYHTSARGTRQAHSTRRATTSCQRRRSFPHGRAVPHTPRTTRVSGPQRLLLANAGSVRRRAALFEAVCARALEGIVAKRLRPGTSPAIAAGRRSRTATTGATSSSGGPRSTRAVNARSSDHRSQPSSSISEISPARPIFSITT